MRSNAERATIFGSRRKSVEGRKNITVTYSDCRLEPRTRKTVLYFHHGRGLGGAPLSLLYVIQGLDRRLYKPVVLCLYESEVVQHFRKHGIDVQVCKGVKEFNHTTAGWLKVYNPLDLWNLIRSVLQFLPSAWRTRNLVRKHNADLVHLNSATLAPSALGVRLAGVPLIWHIRESVVKGHFGFRRAMLRWMVETLAHTSIFICKNNLATLGVKRNGTIIYNFVDFNRWSYTLTGSSARFELGIQPESKVVLLLGGISRIKGTLQLVQAMDQVRRNVPQALALIAGGAGPTSGGLQKLSKLASYLGRYTYGQQVNEAAMSVREPECVQFIPFRTDVEQLVAMSSVVVIPTMEPHFARPAIEAGAMAKPIVASRIGGVEEIVQDNTTGLLVIPGDPTSLAEAITKVLTNSELSRRLGDGGYSQATHLFNSERNIKQVTELYERVLYHMDTERQRPQEPTN